jgi:hypothetical protein
MIHGTKVASFGGGKEQGFFRRFGFSRPFSGERGAEGQIL